MTEAEFEPAPDLQKLVERAGRRLAARLGEPYDAMRHPGWPEITKDEWAEFDRAMEDWQALRLAQFRRG